MCDFAQEVKQFKIVSTETELIAPKAACRWKEMLFWMGRDDFYEKTKGPIGLPVRDACYDSLNQDALDTIFLNKLVNSVFSSSVRFRQCLDSTRFYL